MSSAKPAPDCSMGGVNAELNQAVTDTVDLIYPLVLKDDQVDQLEDVHDHDEYVPPNSSNRGTSSNTPTTYAPSIILKRSESHHTLQQKSFSWSHSEV